MLKTRYQTDTAIEVGLDEVGRGCLWGPLVTGAVIWPPEEEWTDEIRALAPQIKDSKKLSEKKRNQVAALIKDYAIDYAVGVVEPQEIDILGMTKSNQTAFARAVRGLTVEPERLLVDGILSLSREDWAGEQHTIIEGDAQFIPIAAASILAKVYRDTWVTEWAKDNEAVASRYGLVKSKGYGTAVHRAALQAHGPHEGHRRLFLRKILGDSIYTPPEQQTQTQNQYNYQQQCQIQDDPDID
jgi:ribonuclease HII